VKKDRNLGFLLSAAFFSVGTYLLRESARDFRPYMDLCILAGATILAIGLMLASWSLQRHLLLRRLEQHVTQDQQVNRQ
jgi:hypothetical protein